MNQTAEVILNEKEINASIDAMAEKIRNEFPDPEKVLILGIRTRGAILSERLMSVLSGKYGSEISGGILDITLYRDDLSAMGPQPMVRDSEIPHDITGCQIIVVDDVLFTGRTIRAAMDEIIDYGRPKLIRLAVLVDRGCHEYPIRADYIGKQITTTYDQRVEVSLSETDGSDEVVLKS